MALSTARKKANAKYEAKAYDKTLIRLPKGRLDEIRAHIEPAGESLNGFIGRAISETMEREAVAATGGAQRVAVARAVYIPPAALKAAQAATQPTVAAQMAAAVASLSPQMLETVQIAAEAAGESLPDFVRRAVETQAQRDKAMRGPKR